jgi:hypothetical protein
METFSGDGELRTPDGDLVAKIAYEYRIDRTHRVWKGTARRTDSEQQLDKKAGPAVLVVSSGDRAQVNYYHRFSDGGAVIAFTGRGAPPGE